MDGDRHSVFELLRLAQLEGPRRFVKHNVVWLVYELPGPMLDRRSAPSLVFESDDKIRRVRGFPDDWRTLSDADLWELSWTR